MRAVLSETYGAMPELREVPEPRPDQGEVKIRVRASSLNGFDAKVAAGYMQGMMEHQFPVVLGRDFAGTIIETGNGVSQFMPGEEVFGVVTKPVLGDGAFAEYVVVPQEIGVAPIPAGLDYHDAGVLGLAGVTALAVVDAVHPEHGETVLISGATGGVGSYAVQIAAARGATVIATASPGAATDQLHSMGAAHTIDYHGDVIGQVRELAPAGVDAVLHLAGDAPSLASLLAPGGRMASTLGAGPDQVGGENVTIMPVNGVPDRAMLDWLATETIAGRLVTPIARTYQLNEVPQAIADFNSPGTLGKLAITID